MNRERDLDRLLDQWLGEGLTVAPDRVLDVLADRISHRAQRPAWRFIPWRFVIMTRPVRLAALVAVLLVAVAGAVLLGGGATPPSPPSRSASPSAASSQAASASAVPSAATAASTPSASAPPAASPTTATIECRSPQAPACVGRLEAGTHDSRQFAPAFRYTVPADWWNFDAWNTTYAFHRFGDPADQLILMYSDPGVAESGATCDGTAIAGPDATADDWLAFFAGHPGLAASAPVAVDVGGSPAMAVDIVVREEWTSSCFGARVPVVRYATDLYWPFDGWGIAAGERRRLIPVDAPDGRVVLIEIDANTAAPFDEFVAASMPIIESIDFAE